MKAILVIDMPNGINIEKCFIKYTVYHGSKKYKDFEIKCNETGILKPMPEKLEQANDENTTPCTRMFARGYNLCVDEILGEK